MKTGTFLMLIALLLAAALPAQAESADDYFLALSKAYRAAAEKISPAVVHLMVDRVPTPQAPAASGARRRLQLPPSVQEKFVEHRRYLARPDGGTSGVLISQEGHILTSYYNVMGRIRGIKVKLADGRVLAAKILGRDENVDLCLIKADGTGLPYAELSPGIRIRPGQFCVAVGRGLSPENITMTTGIVSARSRNRGLSFQISARVNYANAGGAVVDLRGRLLGVITNVAHTPLINRAGINTGVGLASPVPEVLKIIDRLKAGQTIPRFRGPFLGIRFDQSYTGEGVKIEYVYDGLPSRKAGLEPGDVLILFNNVPIKNRMDLIFAIQKCDPNQKVGFAVTRVVDGQEKSIEMWAVLTLRPNPEEMKKYDAKYQIWLRAKVLKTLGLAIDLDHTGRGMKIKTLDPDGRLGKTGLKVNDVVLTFNRRPIQALADFWVAYTTQDAESAAVIQVSRVTDGVEKLITLTVKLDKK